jgi:hypothetical protein
VPWEAAAIALETGADICRERPDLAEILANLLLAKNSTDARDLWGLMTLWTGLSPSTQAQVLGYLHVERMTSDHNPLDHGDTLLRACSVRLAVTDYDPMFLAFRHQLSNRHSSGLDEPFAWRRDDYVRWTVTSAGHASREGLPAVPAAAPASRWAAWQTILWLLDRFRTHVEDGRGWELLWDDGNPRDERSVQNLFSTYSHGAAPAIEGLIIREPETGRGPVDFTFLNGTTARIQIEFKLATNKTLTHGIERQVPEYGRAQGAEASVVVITGFHQDDKARFEAALNSAEKLRSSLEDHFLDVLYIDARRRVGASR